MLQSVAHLLASKPRRHSRGKIAAAHGASLSCDRVVGIRRHWIAPSVFSGYRGITTCSSSSARRLRKHDMLVSKPRRAAPTSHFQLSTRGPQVAHTSCSSSSTRRLRKHDMIVFKPRRAAPTSPLETRHARLQASTRRPHVAFGHTTCSSSRLDAPPPVCTRGPEVANTTGSSSSTRRLRKHSSRRTSFVGRRRKLHYLLIKHATGRPACNSTRRRQVVSRAFRRAARR